MAHRKDRPCAKCSMYYCDHPEQPTPPAPATPNCVRCGRIRMGDKDCSCGPNGEPIPAHIASELTTLRQRLAEAEARAEDFKRIGQGFERDMRKHFQQSCDNLQRAEKAVARTCLHCGKPTTVDYCGMGCAAAHAEKDDHTVLPPAEIADHATALGWTVESEVWKDPNYKCYRVFPSGMVKSPTRVFPTSLSRADCEATGHTLLPNRRVPKPKPAAASAWEEWQLIRVSTDPNKWNDAFNAFVSSREKAAVERERAKHPDVARECHPFSDRLCGREGCPCVRSKYPKPDAGRSEGVKPEPLPNPTCVRCGDNPSCGDGAWRWEGKNWEHRCRDLHPQVRYTAQPNPPAPKPRRAPEVVAEEITRRYEQHRPAIDGRAFLVELIVAAVMADRGE